MEYVSAPGTVFRVPAWIWMRRGPGGKGETELPVSSFPNVRANPPTPRLSSRDRRDGGRSEGGVTSMDRELPPILLVEDDPIDVALFRRGLRILRPRTDLTVARDGDEAVQM